MNTSPENKHTRPGVLSGFGRWLFTFLSVALLTEGVYHMFNGWVKFDGIPMTKLEFGAYLLTTAAIVVQAFLMWHEWDVEKTKRAAEKIKDTHE